MENVHKHLDFLQLTITRMGANSFLIKGWSVTLVSALFVLFADNSERLYSLLALIPAVLFWGLDGYFLWQERRFRIVYDVVRLKDDADVDFAMHDPAVEKNDKGWFAATFSRTLLTFHGALIVAIITVFYIERCFSGS
jgi:hypothetical protein